MNGKAFKSVPAAIFSWNNKTEIIYDESAPLMLVIYFTDNKTWMMISLVLCTSYGEYISLLFRFARASNQVSDFKIRNKILTDKLPKQG